MTEVLSVREIVKIFGAVRAVDGVSFSVRQGTITGLLGRNGAGKTTTIRMITGIFLPDSGSIEWSNGGRNPQDRIGYLPEERGLYKKMKIGDQLKFFAELKNIKGKEADHRVDQWLQKLKLTEWKNKKSMELSKGMQQKVQFITAVLHDPDIVILDEPFSGLDPVNVALLKEIVLELKAAHKTIIFSTHQMELAEQICDDICLINRSRKVLDGSLREIKKSFGRNAVALRIEGENGILRDSSLVSKIQQYSDEMEVLLAPNADPQDLLRKLVVSGANVTKFEMIEPSLHDIFIEKVSAAE